MSLKRKIILGVMALVAIIAGAICGYWQLHPLLRYLVDGPFLWCMLAVVLSVSLLALMYFRIIGVKRGARATFSLLVVLLTVVSSSLFGLVTAKLASVTPTGINRVDYTVSLLIQLVNGANFVLSFGTTAIAVALLAGMFPKPDAVKTRGTSQHVPMQGQ